MLSIHVLKYYGYDMSGYVEESLASINSPHFRANETPSFNIYIYIYIYPDIPTT
jgi:hypothetical protein